MSKCIFCQCKLRSGNTTEHCAPCFPKAFAVYARWPETSRILKASMQKLTAGGWLFSGRILTHNGQYLPKQNVVLSPIQF